MTPSGITVNAFCPGFVPGTSLSRDHRWFVRWIIKSVLPRFFPTTTLEQATENYFYYGTSDVIAQQTGLGDFLFFDIKFVRLLRGL